MKTIKKIFPVLLIILLVMNSTISAFALQQKSNGPIDKTPDINEYGEVSDNDNGFLMVLDGELHPLEDPCSDKEEPDNDDLINAQDIFEIPSEDGGYDYDIEDGYLDLSYEIENEKDSLEIEADMEYLGASDIELTPPISVGYALALINALPGLSDITLDDEEAILTAKSVYDQLSESERQQIDNRAGFKSDQSAGRELENCVWGLYALKTTDNTTLLADGTYDGQTYPQISSSFSNGKSADNDPDWQIISVTVADCKSFAVISVESSSFEYIRTNGQTYHASYDEAGNALFENIPLDLNGTLYYVSRNTSSSYESAYTLTNAIDEDYQDSSSEIAVQSITLEENVITMYIGEHHEAVGYEIYPSNATVKTVMWVSSEPEIVSVDSETGELDALALGSAVIYANAGEISENIVVNVIEEPDEFELYELSVENNTAMFKVIDAYITILSDGTKKLFITLSGQGYRDIFKGSYNEALAADNTDERWISGVLRTDNVILSDGTSLNGKWQFEIPVENGETMIQLNALSYTHILEGFFWYPRMVIIDMDNSILITDDYKANETLEIDNSSEIEIIAADLYVVGGPNSNNYNIDLNLYFDETIDKIFIGTQEKITEDSEFINVDEDGKFAFVVEKIVGSGTDSTVSTRIGSPFAVSVHGTDTDEWLTLEVTIDRSGHLLTVKTFDDNSSDSGNDDFDNEDSSSSSDLMPSSVNNSTNLPNGVYTGDVIQFRFSGGTGKSEILCTKVEIINGKAYATIVFTRKEGVGGSAQYDALRASGRTYYGANTFTIPVRLDTNNTVVGRTTAMSQAYWIDYTIYIHLDVDADGNSSSHAASDPNVMDTEVPYILGLNARSEQNIIIEFSNLVRVFSYEGGYYLIEINVFDGTFRETEAYKEYIENKKETSSDTEIIDDESSDDNNPAVESVSSLYEYNVLKYLVIPEGKELPAGLDKDFLIIYQPADKAYVTSFAALDIMDDLSVLWSIIDLGMDPEDITNVSVNKYLNENTESVSFCGTYNDWDIRQMIIDKINIAIEDSRILSDETEDVTSAAEIYLRLGERSNQMDMAMFIDRSSDEENRLARAEWYKVYGVLFGEEDRGNSLFKDIYDSCSIEEIEQAKSLISD